MLARPNLETRKKILGILYKKITGKELNLKLEVSEMLKLFKPIEEMILAKFKKNLAPFKNSFFSFEPLEQIEIVRKYFPLIIVSSIRNLGKTVAMRKKALAAVKRGENFLWLRNTDKEIKAFAKSEMSGWFAENEWSYRNYVVYNKENKIVGYLAAINGLYALKGNDYSKVHEIFWDEFNLNHTARGIKNKWNALSVFLNTVERRKKGLKIWLVSNFVNPYDEILAMLGVNVTGEDKDLYFDWEAGAVFVQVRNGWFKQHKEKDLLKIGFRTSVKSKEAFEQQYEDKFFRPVKYHLVNQDYADFATKHLFFIIRNHDYFHFFETSKKTILVASNNNFTEKVPSFALTEFDRLSYPLSKPLSNALKFKIKRWLLKEKLKFSSKLALETVISFISDVVKEKPWFEIIPSL